MRRVKRGCVGENNGLREKTRYFSGIVLTINMLIHRLRGKKEKQEWKTVDEPILT